MITLTNQSGDNMLILNYCTLIMISMVITTSPVNVVDCEGFGEEYKRENNTDSFPGLRRKTNVIMHTYHDNQWQVMVISWRLMTSYGEVLQSMTI